MSHTATAIAQWPSEFAVVATGTNPHYETPGNPADRARVPGGSPGEFSGWELSEYSPRFDAWVPPGTGGRLVLREARSEAWVGLVLDGRLDLVGLRTPLDRPETFEQMVRLQWLRPLKLLRPAAK